MPKMGDQTERFFDEKKSDYPELTYEGKIDSNEVALTKNEAVSILRLLHEYDENGMEDSGKLQILCGRIRMSLL